MATIKSFKILIIHLTINLNMPIVIKDYTWNQTETNLIIQVPFRSLNPAKADIFFSPQYIKVSLNQIFFEVLLFEPVDVGQSKCTKLSNAVIFELVKCTDRLWKSLEPNISKQEKFDLKQKLIKEEHERFQNECNERGLKKSELKKVAVREHIHLETKQRQNIDSIKKYEQANALGDVDDWTNSMNSTEPLTIVEIEDEDIIKPNVYKPKTRINKKPAPKKETKVKEDTAIPRPRTSRSLQILFTPREFPTPSRESNLEEENEWLSKQAAARRSSGFVSEDIRSEEKNPQFLLAKGDEFKRNMNYLGAISAYSFGIKLSDKFVDLYIARSEAHLALENYNRAINDCSTAIDLLKPAVPINLKQRALCIGRRGVALCKLNMFKHGISELEASVKLFPDDHFVKELEDARKSFNEMLT